MENIIKDFVELATKDRKVLLALKVLAVNNQRYDLAANLRSIELEKYPEAKKKQIKLILIQKDLLEL